MSDALAEARKRLLESGTEEVEMCKCGCANTLSTGLYAVIAKAKFESEFRSDRWAIQTAWGNSQEDALHQAKVNLEREFGMQLKWVGVPIVFLLETKEGEEQ